MSQSIFETGAYIIDDGPEYQDTTHIKIDYYSDDEHDENMSSRDTSNDRKTDH
jgi:hypothetical protein